MYPVTQSILDGLQRSHSRSTTVEIFTGDERIVDSSDIGVLDGTINIDGTAAIRRRATTKLQVPASLMPANAGDPLAPFGNEARVKQTVTIDTGESATIPCGVFRISNPATDDSGAGSFVNLTTYDRSRSIQRSQLTTPYTVLAGLNYVPSIQALVDAQFPNLVWNVASTNFVTPLLNFPVQTDPWKQAMAMTASIGDELYFDVDGHPTIAAQPNPATAPPVVEFIEGETCTIIDFSDNLNDDPGYNGACVIGQPSQGLPVISVRWDTNEQSATYYLGPYLRNPTFFVSQYIATQAQADQAADALLLSVLGIAESVTFTAIPNPALDAGDVIRVKRAASNTNDIFVIDTISLPFLPTALMTVTAHRRKVTS